MDRDLTLVEHLSELRKRIVISLVALGVATLGSFPFASILLSILKRPSSGRIEKLVFFSPQEAFTIYLNLSLFLGLVISMPFILYQSWLFVSPAIEERPRKHILFFILLCFAAFVIGGAFSYFILIPSALKFLLSFASSDLEPVISAGKYISFVIALIFGAGLVFQMPVLSFILSKLGIINYRILRKKYKYAVVVIFIFAAAITPTTDIFNMLILAFPMLFLYELSIWIARGVSICRKQPSRL